MTPEELSLTLPETQTTTRTYKISGWRGDVVVLRQTAGMTEQALLGMMDLHVGDVVDVEVRATVRRPERRRGYTKPGSMTETILADLAHGGEVHACPAWRAQIAQEANVNAASIQNVLSMMVASGRLVRTRPGWYRLSIGKGEV